MPGPIPARWTFPGYFVQEDLDTDRSRTVAVQIVQRFRLALLLHEQPGMQNDHAAKAVGLSPRQVQRWRSRWANGDFSVEDLPDADASPLFPPLDQALIHALACEVIAETEEPLSRQSLADLVRWQTTLGKKISRSTVWRMLHEAAIKPWQYEHWLFAKDRFAEKAGPILDLYAGNWEGQPLGPKDYVLSMDEKTSIQAAGVVMRKHRPNPSRPGGSKRSTTGTGRCSIWRRGMSIVASCWADARRRRGSSRLVCWWIRCWSKRSTRRRRVILHRGQRLVTSRPGVGGAYASP